MTYEGWIFRTRGASAKTREVFGNAQTRMKSGDTRSGGCEQWDRRANKFDEEGGVRKTVEKYRNDKG
ncbi:hypothetical protein PLACP1_06250 [Planifilum fimeticola]